MNVAKIVNIVCGIIMILFVIWTSVRCRSLEAKLRDANQEIQYLRLDVGYLQKQHDKLSMEVAKTSSRMEVLDVRLRHASSSLIVNGKMATKLGEDLKKAINAVEGQDDEAVTIIGESPDPDSEPEKDQYGNVIFPEYERVSAATNAVP